jgi:Uma2 family endonuclease
MNAVAEKTVYTPEDLLAMPDEKDFELVDGQLVERHMGVLSSWVAGELLFLIRSFLRDHPLGWVLGSDNGYQCFPDDPRKVRRADVSFIRRGRFPGDRLPNQGYAKIPPDLAVEVVSPNDLAVEIDQKVIEYLQAGVPLIWVVNPDSRVVRVHRAVGPVGWLTEADELSGEGVLPGFRCRVGALFPPPAAAEAPAGA